MNPSEKQVYEIIGRLYVANQLLSEQLETVAMPDGVVEEATAEGN